MIEELVTKSLILVLGYAYPAFQCFKTVESNRVEIHELRFWCQYWITVAVITILEKVGDVFISWLPMYGEMKLAFFIYLWYPQSKGTRHIYETLLRPCVSKHEMHIDRSLLEFRERAWTLAIYYWQNCTELGSTKILQFLELVTSQTARSTIYSSPENAATQTHNALPPSAQPPPRNGPPTSSPPDSPSGGLFRRFKGEKRRPSGAGGIYRNQATKSESIKVELQNQTHFIRPEDVLVSDPDIGRELEEKTGIGHDLQAARLRLRRFIDGRSGDKAHGYPNN